MRLVLILASVVAVSATDSTFWGNYWNITEWFWQSSVVVGDILYIEGGEFYSQPDLRDPAVDKYQLGGTFSIDLSRSWSNSTVAGNYHEHDKFQNILRPNLFYNPIDQQVYRWGGWPYYWNVSYSTELWTFTPTSDGSVNWGQAPSFQTAGLPNAAAPFGAAFVSTSDAFYALGGSNMTTSPDYPVEGLTEYNFTSGQWSNISSVGATESGFIVQGALSSAPSFGSQGFLVSVGGVAPTNSNYDWQGGNDVVNMNTVALYDLGTQTWYRQEATGDIPLGRSQFCWVGATSSDSSKFELFIYGGATNDTYDLDFPNDDGFLNVYALSLPAFRWFKSERSSPVRRANHWCQVIGNRQMLSIGGQQVSNPDPGGQPYDPWTNGLGIFDMTAFDWASFFDAQAAAYETPNVIQDYYNNSYVEPKWGDSALASVFKFNAPSHPSSTSTSTPTSSVTGSSSTASSSPTPSHSSHAGAIAGGVVGGLVVLGLIGGLIFFFLRRKKTPTEKGVDTPVETAEDKPPLYESGGKEKDRSELPESTPELQGQTEFPKSPNTIKRKPVAQPGFFELSGS